MIETSKVILEFLLVFLIVYVISYFVGFKKIKKYDRKKLPSNIKFLVFKYNVDVVSLGYKRVYKTLMLCDSFIVAILYSVTRFIDNIYIRLLVCFILVFPLLAGIYYLVACYYKKESE